MANKTAVNFTFLFEADGTTATIAISLATGPIFYSNPNAYALLSPTLNAALASAVTGVTSPGNTVSGAAISLTTLTVTFASAPAAGLNQVSGTLEF